APRVAGVIDAISRGTLSGWAIDSRLAGKPVTVLLEIDGQIRGTTNTNIIRNDLATSFINKQLGYSLQLPVLTEGANTINVYVVDARGNSVLIGSRLFTAATPLFNEAYYLQTNP